MTSQMSGVSLRARRSTIQVMLGVSLWAGWDTGQCDTTLVIIIRTNRAELLAPARNGVEDFAPPGVLLFPACICGPVVVPLDLPSVAFAVRPIIPCSRTYRHHL